MVCVRKEDLVFFRVAALALTLGHVGRSLFVRRESRRSLVVISEGRRWLAVRHEGRPLLVKTLIGRWSFGC